MNKLVRWKAWNHVKMCQSKVGHADAAGHKSLTTFFSNVALVSLHSNETRERNSSAEQTFQPRNKFPPLLESFASDLPPLCFGIRI